MPTEILTAHSKAGFTWIALLNKFLEMTDLVEKDRNMVPRNIHLQEKHQSFSIEYSWFKFKYLLVLILAPLCSFVLINSQQVAGSFNELTVSVIGIIVLNIIIVYYSITRLLNTTSISVDHDRIQIKHSPVPLLKNLTIDRENLSQLYVTKHQTSHRYYLYSTAYQVNAILKNDTVIKLVGGLSDPEQGIFIERKIEHFLGITDIAVEGEIGK